MPTTKLLSLIMVLSAGMSEAFAQSFADCPGQEVGAIPGLGKVSAYYSQCTSTDQATGDEYHWALVINADSGNIEISRQLPGGLVPSPTNAVSIGVQDPLKFGVSDMGDDYSGSCNEVSSTTPGAPQMDGNTYCGWTESVTGRKILLKGTLTKGSFSGSAIRTTDTDGDGDPDGSDPTPNGPVAVPTTPLWVILMFVPLLGVWLSRRYSGRH